MKNILKEVYNEAIIEELDVADIRAYLADFTLEKCKVVLCGNELFDQNKYSVKLTEPISQLKKDKWFGTKYQLYNRPTA